MLGLFPMADAEAKELFWVDPDLRGVIPFDNFLSRSLRKSLRKQHFAITFDRDFKGVMEACREKRPERPSSWINDEIIELYCELHERGHAHSIEARLDGQLVGGLYGVSLGAAFFGESMFSRVTDASKTALVYLVARLKAGGYTLLDTQFQTEHLRSFGAMEVPRGRYHTYLQEALETAADFYSFR